MKYFYLGGSLLIIVLAIVVFKGTKTDEAQLAEETTTEAVASALVTPLSLDVSLAAAGSPDFILLSTTTEAKDGSSIKTSPSGRAIVAREQAILSSLDNNTEITLNLTPNKKESKINLLVGRVWSKVGRALEQDETFSVYTPTMVAAVRGTSFGVTLEPKRSLIVTEGTVQATRRDRQTGEPIASSTVAVEAGFVLEDDGTTFTIRPITNQDRDEWFTLHTPQPSADGGNVSGTATPSVFETFNNVVPPVGVPPPVLTGTTPAPANLPNVTSVSPKRFDAGQVAVVRIYGDNLGTTKEVRLNGDPAEFMVTTSGVVVINTSEFRDGFTSYDLTLTTPTGTDSVSGAFILEETPSPLRISSASFTYDQTQNQVIAVRGSGFGGVESVRVQNEPVKYTVVSDSEIRVPYVTSETSVVVEIITAGETARTTVSR